MVNENKGKVYQPVPVWDRKIMRSVIRSEIIKRDGYSKVNPKMHIIFKELQRRNKEEQNNG